MKASVQFSRSVMPDSLRPHELQHTRPPCPSPTPGVHLNSHPSNQWCHPAISSSVITLLGRFFTTTPPGKSYAYIYPYKKVKRKLFNPVILNRILKNMWRLLRLNFFHIFTAHPYSFINCQFMSQLFIWNQVSVVLYKYSLINIASFSHFDKNIFSVSIFALYFTYFLKYINNIYHSVWHHRLNGHEFE